MEKNKTGSFCIKPFNAVKITTDGRIKTCCDILPGLTKFKGNTEYNIKKNDIKDYWNSDYRKYLTDSFLKGKKPSECVECWKAEADNTNSIRQWANQRHKILFKNRPEKFLKLLKKNDLPYPEDFDIHPSNLCNLKCHMCSGKYSSKLLVEDNELELDNLKQSDYNMNKSVLEKYLNDAIEHKIDWLIVSGGEPLINRDFLSMLTKMSKDKHVAENLHIEITSNATACNDKIIKILEKFKKLRMIFSLDSTGPVNEYMRYPSKWTTIQKNIERFLKLKNGYFIFQATVQNLNILNIKELVEYAYEKEVHLLLHDLRTPEYLHLSNLPKKILRKAYDRLLTIDKEKTIHVDGLDKMQHLLKVNMQNGKTNNHLMNEFKSIIAKRDQYRKIQIKEYLPELATDLNI